MDNNMNNNMNGFDNTNDNINNTNNNNYDGMNNDMPPKKSSKLLKILIPVIAVVAVLAIVCVANASNIKKFYIKHFGSPVDYYKSVEAANLETLGEQGAAAYDNAVYAMGSLNDKTYSVDMKVKLEDGAEPYVNMLGAASDYDFSWAKQAGVSADIISNKGEYGINGSLSLNDVNITDFNAAYSSDDKAAYLSVPALTDKVAEIPADTEVDIKKTVEAIDKLFDELPESDTVQDIIVKYGMIIINDIDDIATEDTDLSAGDISQECTAYIAECDDNTLKNMLVDICEEIKKDDDIKSFITKGVSAVEDIVSDQDSADMSGDEAYDEFISSVDELISTVKEADNSEELQATITTYINNKDEIIGRVLDIGAAKIEYKMPLDGDEFGMEVNVYTVDSGMDSPIYSITGKGTLSDNMMSGDFEMTGIDIPTAVAYSIKDIDIEAAMKGEMKGTISYDLGNVMSETGVSGMDGLGIDIVMDTNREKKAMDIVVRLNTTELATIRFTVAIDSAKPVDIPASDDILILNSSEDMVSWFATMKFDKIIASLESANVDEKIIDMLEQYISLLSMGY